VIILIYFNVSLDYLLRDAESGQKENNSPRLNNIKVMEAIKQFYNNLSVKQQQIGIIFFFVIGIGSIALIGNAFIDFGKNIGEVIYYLAH